VSLVTSTDDPELRDDRGEGFDNCAGGSDCCAQPSELLPSAAGVVVLAKSFRALGDPTRLRLLEFLLAGEHSVTDCVRHAGVAQSRVSTHLAALADAGYVKVRRSGQFAFYSAPDPRVAEAVRLARSIAADHAAARTAAWR
jgi:ArsR family transcriptional regulator, cadmium/lead-responsive transcriptional repressor